MRILLLLLLLPCSVHSQVAEMAPPVVACSFAPVPSLGLGTLQRIPGLFGPAGPDIKAAGDFLRNMQAAHPGPFTLSRFGDQLMVLPQQQASSAPKGGPGIKVGVYTISKPDAHRILHVSQEAAARIHERLGQGNIGEAHAILDQAFDGLDPGSAMVPAEQAPSASPEGFVRLEAGRFTMGSPLDEPGREADEGQHEVLLTHPFWMKETPVTQEDFERVMGSNPSRFKGRDKGQHPVESLTWFEAVEYCNKRSEMERLKPAYIIERYPDGAPALVRANGPSIYETGGYRLPTEWEAEYAMRAGSKGPHPFELGDLDKHVVHHSNSGGQTQPVGTKEPNAWGLRDMIGNVRFWTDTWYDRYPTGKGLVTDPTGPAGGTWRSDRGISFSGNIGSFLRSGHRGGGAPDYRHPGAGLRPVRSIPAEDRS